MVIKPIPIVPYLQYWGGYQCILWHKHFVFDFAVRLNSRRKTFNEHPSVLKPIINLPDNIDFCEHTPLLGRKCIVWISSKSNIKKDIDCSKSKESVELSNYVFTSQKYTASEDHCL